MTSVTLFIFGILKQTVPNSPTKMKRKVVSSLSINILQAPSLEFHRAIEIENAAAEM